MNHLNTHHWSQWRTLVLYLHGLVATWPCPCMVVYHHFTHYLCLPLTSNSARRRSHFRHDTCSSYNWTNIRERLSVSHINQAVSVKSDRIQDNILWTPGILMWLSVSCLVHVEIIMSVHINSSHQTKPNIISSDLISSELVAKWVSLLWLWPMRTWLLDSDLSLPYHKGRPWIHCRL